MCSHLKTEKNLVTAAIPFLCWLSSSFSFQVLAQKKVGMCCFLSQQAFQKMGTNQIKEFFGQIINRLPLHSELFHNPFFSNFSSMAWILQTASFLA